MSRHTNYKQGLRNTIKIIIILSTLKKVNKKIIALSFRLYSKSNGQIIDKRTAQKKRSRKTRKFSKIRGKKERKRNRYNEFATNLASLSALSFRYLPWFSIPGASGVGSHCVCSLFSTSERVLRLLFPEIETTFISSKSSSCKLLQRKQIYSY